MFETWQQPASTLEIINHLASEPVTEAYEPSLSAFDDGPIKKIHTGLPQGSEIIRLIQPTQFRHFLRSPEHYRQIMAEGFRCGRIPYEQKVGGGSLGLSTIDRWPNIKGFFFTRPHVENRKVGVINSKLYFDFTLPAETQIIQLEDNILIIPMEEGDLLNLSELNTTDLKEVES